MIHITLPDGSVKEFEKGTTPYQIALSISEGLARNVLAAKVNNQIVSLNYEINDDASLTLLTWNDAEGKSVFWHSSAHLMAAAIEQLYPGVKFGIGPHIENGFYYDIDFMDYSISSDDFPKIEAKMQEIASKKT
ncbi:MAG: TGS domain-containing protein, partial [Bacteroidales bacterium]